MSMNAHPVNHQLHRRVDELPPIWKNRLDRGIHLRLYRNGDHNYPGKSVILNKKQFRTFESWLSELSNSMRLRNGAIWRVYTPTHGTRKDDFNDIEEGQSLVVAGQERFKPLRYDQITASERKRSPPFKYDADPVYHSRQYQSSGKIHKCETHSILIKVWANGGDLKGPRRVLLTPRVRPFTLPNILAHVNEMLKEDCVGTVEKLHFLNGIKVVDPDQISQNGEYVACRRNERFIKARYTEFGTKNISTSPRLERKRLAPLGLASNSSTNNSSPEHSNASTQNSVNGYARRRAAPRREEDQVFPAKPVKHTRSSDRVRTVDLDKDEGGVFKAKQNNRTTRGAREVQDTRHTRTELPVDQREAREVEEEKTDHRRQQAPPPPPQQQQQQQQQPTRHRGGVQAKPNSRRPPAPAKDTQQQQQPQQQQQKQQRNKDLEFKRNQSATKIQANYRGYKARRSMNQQTKDKKKEPQETDHSQSNYHGQRSLNASRDSQRASRRSPKEEPRRSPQVDARRSPNVASRDRQRRQQEEEEEEQARAAAKIQAGYRGHQTRKNRQDQRDPTPERSTQPDRSKDEGQGRNRQETLNSMFEEDMAAAKIQAGYRGHQTRKRLREEKEAAEKIQAGYRGHSTRSQRSRGRNNNDDDLRLREEERAASKIQAGFRGYQTRKDMRGRKPAPASSRSPAREDSYDELARENAAATKIQSQYRGFRARKEYKQRRAR
ncbi:doublecortin domain-containing protein 2 [Aplysia californica]|uniref:Doublecortin domain-containing protein 2 n=1 Tax=Aplysia californica TaxID=6500 RepID=A0ABM1VXH8_APLCA|nr:doublecortin domain-containing protein 2 [Aplysia californica]